MAARAEAAAKVATTAGMEGMMAARVAAVGYMKAGLRIVVEVSGLAVSAGKIGEVGEVGTEGGEGIHALRLPADTRCFHGAGRS